MKLDNVAFQCGRDDTGFLSDLRFLMRKRETGGLADVVFFGTFCKGKNIIDADAGRNLRINCPNQCL